jgi:hypothetical protein
MKKGITLILIVLVAIEMGFAQVTSVSQAQAMFIYNFSRLIQWPAATTSGDYV